jgi:hypothetical protein
MLLESLDNCCLLLRDIFHLANSNMKHRCTIEVYAVGILGVRRRLEWDHSAFIIVENLELWGGITDNDVQHFSLSNSKSFRPDVEID